MRVFSLIVSALLLAACQRSNAPGTNPDKSSSTSWESRGPQDDAPAQESQFPATVTAAEMRRLLGANENARFEKTGRHFTTALLGKSGARTLEPLHGHPLRMLDLTGTKIDDLTPLTGAPLEKVVIADTPVADLSPLSGAPIDMLDATQSQVADLSPVATMVRLEELYLEGAKVRDLTPLRGSRVAKLWLNGCPIESLEPLRGKSLIELNLCDTPIANTDLGVIGSMKIQSLWLRNTAVSDLTPLRNSLLVSLDLQGTSVADLEPLASVATLERLNIAGTTIRDLTPLANLRLTRLIFSPARIQSGLDEIRAMSSLREIDTSFEGTSQAMSPSEFWERYDRGEFNRETSSD